MSKSVARSSKRRSIVKEEEDIDNFSDDFIITDSKKSYAINWTWVFLFLLFSLLVSLIVITIVSIEKYKAKLPKKIDVVLYNEPDIEYRKDRYVYQIRAIRKYMKFVNNIYVLNSTKTEKDTVQNVTYVNFKGTEEEAFQHIPSIEGVAEHVIYMSDKTFPTDHIYKNYLFCGSKPRLFNYFRDKAEEDFFNDKLESTFPTFSMDVSLLKDSSSSNDFLYRTLTEERIVLRNDLNRDVFIDSEMTGNVDKQFEKIVNYTPLFVTFHISNDVQVANNKLNVFLEQHFPA
jgi:hypothetical protein